MLKSELEEELRICGEANNNFKEELRIASAANSTTNKALQDERTETRRLRKVLDRAITAADSRLATLRYVPPIIKQPQNRCDCDGPVIIEKAKLTEEEKFLEFIVGNVLFDQYKPEKRDKFGSGFEELYR